MPTPLCEIALKYRTDKCPEIKHCYTPFYYEYLKDRCETIKKVLEIGIGCKTTMPRIDGYVTGASLYMWREFFPNAQIYGADILPEAIFGDERIKTFLFDETKKEDIERLVRDVGSDVELVIDDGSHAKEHQMYLCATMMPLLNKNVTYIIEDVEFPDKITGVLSEYNVYQPKLHRRYHNDRLLVITHK